MLKDKAPAPKPTTVDFPITSTRELREGAWARKIFPEKTDENIAKLAREAVISIKEELQNHHNDKLQFLLNENDAKTGFTTKQPICIQINGIDINIAEKTTIVRETDGETTRYYFSNGKFLGSGSFSKLMGLVSIDHSSKEPDKKELTVLTKALRYIKIKKPSNKGKATADSLEISPMPLDAINQEKQALEHFYQTKCPLLRETPNQSGNKQDRHIRYALLIPRYSGRNLQIQLDAGKFVTIEEKLELITELANQLVRWHDNAKAAHKDIKPENFMVWRNKDNRIRVFLVDQGSAQPQDTPPEDIVGTKPYMAPEILKILAHNDRGNTTLDYKKADLFSFGVMLYEALFGTLPSFMFPYSPPDRPKKITVPENHETFPEPVFDIALLHNLALPGEQPTEDSVKLILNIAFIIRNTTETDPDKRTFSAAEIHQRLSQLRLNYLTLMAKNSDPLTTAANDQSPSSINFDDLFASPNCMLLQEHYLDYIQRLTASDEENRKESLDKLLRQIGTTNSNTQGMPSNDSRYETLIGKLPCIIATCQYHLKRDNLHRKPLLFLAVTIYRLSTTEKNKLFFLELLNSVINQINVKSKRPIIKPIELSIASLDEMKTFHANLINYFSITVFEKKTTPIFFEMSYSCVRTATLLEILFSEKSDNPLLAIALLPRMLLKFMNYNTIEFHKAANINSEKYDAIPQKLINLTIKLIADDNFRGKIVDLQNKINHLNKINDKILLCLFILRAIAAKVSNANTDIMSTHHLADYLINLYSNTNRLRLINSGVRFTESIAAIKAEWAKPADPAPGEDPLLATEIGYHALCCGNPALHDDDSTQVQSIISSHESLKNLLTTNPNQQPKSPRPEYPSFKTFRLSIKSASCFPHCWNHTLLAINAITYISAFYFIGLGIAMVYLETDKNHLSTIEAPDSAAEILGYLLFYKPEHDITSLFEKGNKHYAGPVVAATGFFCLALAIAMTAHRLNRQKPGYSPVSTELTGYELEEGEGQSSSSDSSSEDSSYNGIGSVFNNDGIDNTTTEPKAAGGPSNTSQTWSGGTGEWGWDSSRNTTPAVTPRHQSPPTTPVSTINITLNKNTTSQPPIPEQQTGGSAFFQGSPEETDTGTDIEHGIKKSNENKGSGSGSEASSNSLTDEGDMIEEVIDENSGNQGSSPSFGNSGW